MAAILKIQDDRPSGEIIISSNTFPDPENTFWLQDGPTKSLWSKNIG